MGGIPSRLTVRDSVFVGNRVVGDGGRGDLSGVGEGGAIYSDMVTVSGSVSRATQPEERALGVVLVAGDPRSGRCEADTSLLRGSQGSTNACSGLRTGQRGPVALRNRSSAVTSGAPRVSARATYQAS